MKVSVKFLPGGRSCELKPCAPGGTLRDVTVWAYWSRFFQATVLFTPTTTVTVSGTYPGAELASLPAPLGIMTMTGAWAFASGSAKTSPATKASTNVVAAMEVLRVISGLCHKSLEINPSTEQSGKG